MDLATILSNAQSQDETTRRDAEERLSSASQKDFAGFLHALAMELANNDRQPIIRQLAGIILKNSVFANDAQRYDTISKQWIAIPENGKNEIRGLLTNTLSANAYEARHTSAQAISKIALIDLPTGSWGTLVPLLIENLTRQYPQGQGDGIKQSTLQTIGYICEEIDPQIMQGFSDNILTVIIHGMRDASNIVKQASTEALYNALEFVKHNFEKKEERDYIMKTIFETSVSTEPLIKKLAFENLVKIVNLYYEYIIEYMVDIYNLTVGAIQNEPNEGVVLQAIEFWTTLCEEELNLQDDNLSQDVMEKALAPFLPVILTTLLKQDEHYSDSWNVCMAGATCVTYVALNVNDKILPVIIPFIRNNMTSSEWRAREASCVALGSILEGPSETNFQILIAEAVPILIRHVKDPHPMVKDSASWTLGRICAHQVEAVGELLDVILGCFVETSADPEPKVAAHACWGIHNVCQAFEEGPIGRFQSLDQFFPHLAKALYVAAHRPDADQESLRLNAYEALNSLITYSNADPKLVLEVLEYILKDFENSFTMEVLNQEDQDNKKQIQALICSTLQTITTVLKEKVKPHTQKMVYLLFNVFTTQSHIIYEEALLAIGAIIQALEQEFTPYLPAFLPILTHNLRNVEFGDVSNISIGIVSDICRALNKDFTPLANTIIPLIVQDLADTKISMNAKPNALSCLGDIALAIGGDFIPFLPTVMPILERATSVQLDDVEYLNTLRCSIFEAYTGIIHGLKADDVSEQFAPYIQPVLGFVSIVYTQKDDYHSFQVIGAAIGLLGDLAQSLGDQIKTFLRHDIVRNLIQVGMQQEGNRDIAKWAEEIIFK